MSQLGGGIGTRGPGETQLETDRRKINLRIDHVKEQLESVRRIRRQQRQRCHLLIWSEPGDRPRREVAPRRLPFVMLFSQDTADQAHHRGGVGKDADHVGAAFDLFVESLDSVVAIHLFGALRR